MLRVRIAASVCFDRSFLRCVKELPRPEAVLLVHTSQVMSNSRAHEHNTKVGRMDLPIFLSWMWCAQDLFALGRAPGAQRHRKGAAAADHGALPIYACTSDQGVQLPCDCVHAVAIHQSLECTSAITCFTALYDVSIHMKTGVALAPGQRMAMSQCQRLA